MRFDEATLQFLAYCDLERGFSPGTISAYQSDLRQWREYLTGTLGDGSVPLCDITRQLVRGFIVQQRERGLSSTTVGRRINCLRSFWRFLEHAEVVTDNPLEGIRLPKTRSTLPAFLTDDEMRRLLEAAGRTHYRNLAGRDRAVIGTFLFTGVRRTELLKLHVTDLNLEDNLLLVREGKGGRMRTIPVLTPLRELLLNWLDERPSCSHDSLFVNRERQPLGRHAVQVLFDGCRERAAIRREGVTIHTLRHSFACALLRGGANLVAIQQLMGHVSLDTTSIYLRVTGAELREAVAVHSLSTTSAGAGGR